MGERCFNFLGGKISAMRLKVEHFHVCLLMFKNFTNEDYAEYDYERIVWGVEEKTRG